MELRQLQIRPYLGTSKCLGHSVLQTPALILFVCCVRLISFEIFSGVTWVKSLEKITRKSFVKGIRLRVFIIIEPEHDKTSKITCASNDDSNQPGHLHCLISHR